VFKGYVQIYTGNGKGKTTAAIGLALRAAGSGMKVFIAQFLKKRKCSEHKALERLSDLITIKRYGEGFVKAHPERKHILAVRKGIEEVKKIINGGEYNLVILDEINLLPSLKLINVEEIIDIIKNKPKIVEIVLTGRYAPEELIQIADLVTEMKEIKHYYSKGIKARKGIEY